jgi:membrane protease YdiL (CAAX protease family)
MGGSSFNLTARQAVWTLVEYVALTVLCYLAALIVVKVLQHTEVIPVGTTDGPVIVGEIIGAIWAIRRARRRYSLAGLPVAGWNAPPGGGIAPFSVLMIGSGMLLCGVDNIIEAIAPAPAWFRETMDELMNPAKQPVVGFVAIVVVAPVIEELICRGLILRGLLGTYRPAQALVISSLLFALMHLNPWQVATAFVGGMLLGWAYIRTRSLALCIAGHALHNAIVYFSFSLPFEIRGVNSTPAPGDAHFIPWWFVAVGVALAAIGATWFHRSAPAARPV